ncbi:unnamed protein product [Rotaria magnacalcarata]|uniref:Helix-turn-helix domain-containing protein n=1 Tax=Rotaria magnacalcarata TaxID=392030 RepID=A0A816Q8A8_9BILA|nr:unnamed protein product [Rotaria magnacalcarata]
MNMPSTGISKFLYKLIRPIFDKHARSTTIINGVDLIHCLEGYTTNGHLIPKTYLCTFDITDLYTMLPQEESLDILIEFLLQHGYQKVQNIPIDIIRKLGLIIIKENVFVHEKKFYRQVIGQAVEPYVVPFGSDHPGHVFRNTVDTAITRAVCYSTTLFEFEEEIRQMKLMFLYNGYSPRHIHRRLTTLFSKYLSKYFILPMLNNLDDFDYLRHQFLTASTATAYGKVTRTSTTNQTHDKNIQNHTLQPTDNNDFTTRKRLIIHLRHEKRLVNNHRYIHELWSHTFHQTEIMNTVLIIETYLNHNLEQELMTKTIKHTPNVRSDKQGKTQLETGKQTHNGQAQPSSH